MKQGKYIAAVLSLYMAYGPAMAFAANTTTGSVGIVIEGDNNTVSSSNSITLGNEISSLGGVNVAIGYGSKAGNQEQPLGPNNANGATAVGTGSQAVNYRATALGDYTVASGTDAIGIGTSAQATGDRSISAGLLSEASGVNAIAIGDSSVSSSNDTVAIGEKAHATSSQSIAIGSASSSSGLYSVAIGLNAKATNGWSVALGNGSETAAAVSTRTMAVGGRTYQTAGGTARGTVSVGNEAVKRTITNVAAGRVTASSTDAINGSQLFEVTQSVDANTQNIAKVISDTTVKDGSYIKGSNTVGQNLSALDTGLKTTSVLLENDISRAAAGSNALAALHPMQEFDPDDKAQFALGYGHYRNANAGAVGAFYQPDENSMVNFGVSFGNGDAGINAGVTFKFGPGGSGHHALTKTQMAKVIDAQSKEIDELKKDNADKDKRIDALEQKMTEILAKLDKSQG